MRKRLSVLILGVFILSLAACSSTPRVPSNPTAPEPPTTVGPITFLNVREGGVVRAVMPNAPGASINVSWKVKGIRLELFRPDGTAWWHNDETGSTACITGLKGNVCNSWTTNYAPDGAYKLKVAAKLEDGSTINAEVNFRVGNQEALPPTSTPPSPPSPPSAPVTRPAWNDVRSWMRQDINCNLQDVINSKFSMVTMSVRCTSKLLEPSDLQRIKASGKWVLAYEDVSVAAPWDSRMWPGDVNWNSPFIKFQTAWGSYLADVTSDGWFRVLEKVVRDDLARGYDGIWLDDCAAFWFDGGPTADNVQRYTNIVKRVRALVNSIRPDVKLMCNTDANLIQGSTNRASGFLEALDGITIEGFTYHCFGPGDCRANDPGRRSEEEKWALEAQKRGEKVFTLDYAYTPDTQRNAWSEARKRGWTPAIIQGATIGKWID